MGENGEKTSLLNFNLVTICFIIMENNSLNDQLCSQSKDKTPAVPEFASGILNFGK